MAKAINCATPPESFSLGGGGARSSGVTDALPREAGNQNSKRLVSTVSLLYPSASEVTTLWRYTNLFIIIIIIKQTGSNTAE